MIETTTTTKGWTIETINERHNGRREWFSLATVRKAGIDPATGPDGMYNDCVTNWQRLVDAFGGRPDRLLAAG